MPDRALIPVRRTKFPPARRGRKGTENPMAEKDETSGNPMVSLEFSIYVFYALYCVFYIHVYVVSFL